MRRKLVRRVINARREATATVPYSFSFSIVIVDIVIAAGGKAKRWTCAVVKQQPDDLIVTILHGDQQRGPAGKLYRGDRIIAGPFPVIHPAPQEMVSDIRISAVLKKQPDYFDAA